MKPQKNTAADRFKNFTRNGRRGNSMVYHVGNLQFDRTPSRKSGDAVNYVGELAYKAYLAGRVVLTQRRIGAGICAYVATIR